MLSSIGLSLCVQGTYVPEGYDYYAHRFIPVHTGNIVAALLNDKGEPVYPCAYREHRYQRPRFC